MVLALEPWKRQGNFTLYIKRLIVSRNRRRCRRN